MAELTGRIDVDGVTVLWTRGWVLPLASDYPEILRKHGIEWKKSFTVFSIWRHRDGKLHGRAICGAVRP